MAKAKAAATAVVVAPNNLPANIAEEIRKEAAEIVSRIQAPSGDKIKLTKKKTFKLPDGTEHPGPLTVVILDFVTYNAYFDKPYKEGEPASPACYAIGLDPTSMVPSAKSPDRQADKCSACPMDQFGSKGDGKACRNQRKLVVIAGEGDLATDPNSPMWILEVSPTALKAYDAYVSTVRTQHGVPPYGVVTDIFFDPTVDHQSLRFGNPQPNPNIALHYTRKGAARERLMAEPDTSKYAPAKKATKKK